MNYVWRTGKFKSLQVWKIHIATLTTNAELQPLCLYLYYKIQQHQGLLRPTSKALLPLRYTALDSRFLLHPDKVSKGPKTEYYSVCLLQFKVSIMILRLPYEYHIFTA